MVRLMCRVLTVVLGETRLVSPPRWAAEVGPRWDTADKVPWNLFNLWWRFGQWVVARV